MDITKGTWEAAFRDRGLGHGDFAVLSEPGGVIAEVTLCPEVEKNATLIAESPEMYDVLKQILQDLPTNRDWLDPVLEKRAKAIIYKLNA